MVETKLKIGENEFPTGDLVFTMKRERERVQFCTFLSWFLFYKLKTDSLLCFQCWFCPLNLNFPLSIYFIVCRLFKCNVFRTLVVRFKLKSMKLFNFFIWQFTCGIERTKFILCEYIHKLVNNGWFQFSYFSSQPFLTKIGLPIIVYSFLINSLVSIKINTRLFLSISVLTFIASNQNVNNVYWTLSKLTFSAFSLLMLVQIFL